jgi:hypothetical protein
MSPKIKVIAWIFGILAAYCASVGFGAYRVASAEMFPLAKKGVAAYLVATRSSEANKPIYFKWWSSWYFKNQRNDGWAEMKMCTSSRECHTVIAYTDLGKWQVNVDGNIVNTDKWIVLPNGNLVNAEKPLEK